MLCYLDWWPTLHDTNFTPVWSHVEYQLCHFPQASGYTCRTILFNYEDDIGTQEASSVPDKWINDLNDILLILFYPILIYQLKNPGSRSNLLTLSI